MAKCLRCGAGNEWIDDYYTASKSTKNKNDVIGSLLSFEQCLREEFLLNTQNYPKEYHRLFKEIFERAQKRFREQ